MSEFDEKQNVVIACKSKGYLISNLVEQFEKEDYRVSQVSTMALMNTVTGRTDAFVLYLDE